VLGELTDPLPYAHHAFFAEDVKGRAKAAAKWAVRAAAWKVSPGGSEKLFTVHYAVLTEHGTGPAERREAVRTARRG